MEKFEEKKIVNILQTVSVVLFFLFLTSLLLTILNEVFVFGFLFIPLSFLFLTISKMISNKGKYSSQFIDYMENKVNNSSTIGELEDCLDEFNFLAIRNGMYDLEYPTDLRRIHQKIINQIEILKKI
jgi:hypothetical protein